MDRRDRGEGQGSSPDLTSNLSAFRNAPPGSAKQFCATGELLNSGGDLGVDTIDYGNIQIIRLR